MNSTSARASKKVLCQRADDRTGWSDERLPCEQSPRDYFLRHAPLDFQVDDLVVAHLVDPDILDDVTSLSKATGVPSEAGPSTDRRTRIVGCGLRGM